MGGRALKNVMTRRYNREEFEDASERLIKKLKETFNRATIPLFYREKETFGDIDIILDIDSGNGEVFNGKFIEQYILDTFNPNQIFHNGNAWSFDFEEVQVDLITVHPDNFDSNYHYLAYNDLGNFIGRLAQSIGLKFGQEGLWYVHYGDADNSTKYKIPLSKDYRKIYDFLGLDYNKFVEGFDKLEDIFSFVTTSYYFNPNNFKLHTLNKVNRERNRKRKSYMSFLDFIEGLSPHNDYDEHFVNRVKEDIVDIISSHFPEANIELELAKINYNEARENLVKIKFNGGLIKERYGLEGKKIGDAINGFKEYVFQITDYDFKDFIINFSEDYIWDSFDNYLSKSDKRIT